MPSRNRTKVKTQTISFFKMNFRRSCSSRRKKGRPNSLCRNKRTTGSAKTENARIIIPSPAILPASSSKISSYGKFISFVWIHHLHLLRRQAKKLLSAWRTSDYQQKRDTSNIKKTGWKKSRRSSGKKIPNGKKEGSWSIYMMRNQISKEWRLRIIIFSLYIYFIFSLYIFFL